MKGAQSLILLLSLIAVNGLVARVAQGSVSDLQRLLEPIDQDWPSMVLLLVYNNAEEAKSFAGIKKLLDKLSQRQAYSSYIDFQQIDLSQINVADRQALQELLKKQVDLEDQPLLAAFVNYELQDVLIGRNLMKSHKVRQFIDQAFAVEMARLRRKERAKIKRIIRYEERPAFYGGVGFGSPFYYGSSGWWGRGYPYWPTYSGYYW